MFPPPPLPLFFLITGRGEISKPRWQLLKHAHVCLLWLLSTSLTFKKFLAIMVAVESLQFARGLARPPSDLEIKVVMPCTVFCREIYRQIVGDKILKRPASWVQLPLSWGKYIRLPCFQGLILVHGGTWSYLMAFTGPLKISSHLLGYQYCKGWLAACGE